MPRSLYDLLEVSRDAPPAAINNAAVRLKLQHDPTKPDSDRVQYMAICEAHEILSNPTRRAIYDQKLIVAEQAAFEYETAPPFWTAQKLILVLCAALIGGVGYYNHSAGKAREARELARLKLEQEQSALRKEELRLEQEQARLDREKLRAEREDNYRSENNLASFRRESRQYAAEMNAREERQRYQADYEAGERQREQQREQERLRREARQVRPTVIIGR